MTKKERTAIRHKIMDRGVHENLFYLPRRIGKIDDPWLPGYYIHARIESEIFTSPMTYRNKLISLDTGKIRPISVKDLIDFYKHSKIYNGPNKKEESGKSSSSGS